MYHVYNRGSRTGSIFESSSDYDAFEELMALAREKCQMRIIAYSLMTHIHLLLSPHGDSALAPLARAKRHFGVRPRLCAEVDGQRS